MTESPFDPFDKNLQVAWDATSLRCLMECPQKYKYTIIDGWRKSNVDIEFGSLYASACEEFNKARVMPRITKHVATLMALKVTLEKSWNPETGPWGGEYGEFWRCKGTVPYRNAKGNAAKCPWSHAGQWFPAPAPGTCSCGSETETKRRWVPHDKRKNRVTLVRLVLAYCDQHPEKLEDGLHAYVFPDGTPAVELSFRMPLPGHHMREFTLCGHLDKIAVFGQERFVGDNKTTKNALDEKYWAQFQPNIQMDIYDLVGSTLYEDLDIKGVAVEGAQVLTRDIRFGIGLSYRTDEHREELLDDLDYFIGQAMNFAANDHWPRNRASCTLCAFKKVCAAPPERREAILQNEFVKSHWNPLQER